MPLSKEDKSLLLQLARRALEEALKMRSTFSASAVSEAALEQSEWCPFKNGNKKGGQKSVGHPEWLKPILQSFKISDNSLRAVFVTLNKEGNLRGCIGSVQAESPLLDAVALTALKSAFEDPRFPPLSEQELPQIEIEISVLSPTEKIASHEKIIPRLHGVLIKKGFRSGLFLPQVWEQLPKKEDFLSELCFGKAGLPANAWKDPQTEIFVFTVEHFGENEFQ